MLLRDRATRLYSAIVTQSGGGVLTIEEIQERLKERRPEDVAAATGLSISTVYKYRDGRTQRPTHDVVERLSAYLACAGA